MQATVSEKTVSLVWQYQLIANPVTDSGAKLQIIYPGRPNHGTGCDFKDAVFTIDGKVIRGDIEIHVKSSQWYRHRHHLNSKYNNIALHVTMWHDSSSPTILQSGKTIPAVHLSYFLCDSHHMLSRKIEQASHTTLTCPYLDKPLATNPVGSLLNTAGMERFAAKTALFKKALEKERAGQVLLRGIARALGYSQNTQPCEELANSLPHSLLEQVKSDTNAIKQAWILGTAGLLPSQRPKLQDRIITDRATRKLEKIWRTSGLTATMKEADWCFSRVRPDNFPTRRLVALSYILSRYAKPGLLQKILNLVREAPQGAERRWLENGFMVTEPTYWANHLDFGIASQRSSSLIGKGKAAEIIINVILPFATAWGEVTAEARLREKANEIYRCYHRTEDNELTRYMKQQLRLGQDRSVSACQQQGLIHIFKSSCRHKNCSKCPVALSRN